MKLSARLHADTAFQGHGFRQRLTPRLSSRLHAEEGGSSAAQFSDFMEKLSGAISQTVITPITTAISALPSQMAAAVRVHDEAEAVRLAAAAEETHLERQIQRCMTCTEIGKLDGFDYCASTNKIYCLDCQRYGYKAPGKHKRGATGWGEYEGPS